VKKMLHLTGDRVYSKLSNMEFHDKIRTLIENGSIKKTSDERTLQAYIWSELIKEIIDNSTYFQHYRINVELYHEKGDTPDITIRSKFDSEVLIAIEIKHFLGKNSISEKEWEDVVKDITTLNMKKFGILILTISDKEVYIERIKQLDELKVGNTKIILIEG
jgi:hypothetical protein